MRYNQQILFAFILMLGSSAIAQSVTFNACHPFFEDQNFVLQNVGTDATGRNIFESTPVSGDQPCSGLGVCELKLSWSVANAQWELIGDDGDGNFDTNYLIYKNNSASTPNPPSLALGIWTEDVATTGGACGGDGASSIAVMTGDVQDDLNVLGLSDVELLTVVNIYPNPATSSINIECREVLESVEIYEMTGKLILRTQNKSGQITVSHLNTGMYITKIWVNSKVYINRLLVK